MNVNENSIEGYNSKWEFRISAFVCFVIIPLLIIIGILYFEDRKYYMISFCILLSSSLPMIIRRKRDRLNSRRLVLIASLTAIATLGRIAFFFLPQFKPVVAMVIISAVLLGPVDSFFLGAATGFISNFYFGQGPWTVWQMYCFGMIGFIAGHIFKKNQNRWLVCIYGFFACFVIYGGIMNYASVLMFYSYVTTNSLKAAYLQGIPFDFIHAVATVIFLYFLYPAFVEKITRIKLKYKI